MPHFSKFKIIAHRASRLTPNTSVMPSDALAQILYNFKHRKRHPPAQYVFYKLPYNLKEEPINIPEVLIYELELELGSYSLGYGMLTIHKDQPFKLVGDAAPEFVLQPWFKKDYTDEAAVRFWNEQTQCGTHVDINHQNTPLILLADSRSIDLGTLCRLPQSDDTHLQHIRFTGRGQSSIVLLNGHSRLRSAQLFSAGLNSNGQVQWPACIFDRGKHTSLCFFLSNNFIAKVRGHPRALELQHILAFGDLELV